MTANIINKRPKTSAFKRIWNFTKRLFFVVLLLILGSLISLQIPSLQLHLIHRICDYLTQKTGRDIHVERFFLSCLGTLDIQGLYLENGPGFSPEPLGECQQIHCIFDPLSLFKGHLHIKYFFASSPVFRLEFSEDRNSNIYFFPRKKEKEKKRNPDDDHLVYAFFETLKIDHLDINNGQFFFDYRPSDLTVRAPLISVKADTIPGQKEIKIEVSGNCVETQITNRINTLGNLNLKAFVWADGVHDSSIRVSTVSGKTWISGRCGLKIFTNPRLDFDGTVLLDAEELSDGVLLPIRMNGCVAGCINGSGLATDLEIQASVLNDGFDIANIGFTRVSSSANYTNNAISISDISATIYDGILSGNGDVTFDSASKGYHFQCTGNNIDLAKTLESQNVPVVIPGQLHIETDITSNGFASENLIIEGQASAIERPSLGYQALSLDTAFSFQNKFFSIDSAVVENNEAKIKMKGAGFSSERLDATISLVTSNLAEISDRFNKYSIYNMSLPSATGDLSATVTISGSPHSPITHFSTSSNSLELQGQSLGKVTLKGSAEKHAIRLDTVNIEGEIGQIKGMMDFTKTESKSSFYLNELDLKLDDTELESVHSFLPHQFDLHGKVSGSLKMNHSSGNSIASRIQISQFAAWQVPLGTLQSKFILHHRGISSIEVQTSSNKGDVAIDGEVLFDQSYQLKLTAEQFQLSNFEKWLPFPIDGPAQISMHTDPNSRKFIGHIEGKIDNLEIRNLDTGQALIQATIDLNDPQTISYSLSFADNTGKISGRTRIEPTHSTSLNGTLNQISLKHLLQISPLYQRSSIIDGTTSGSFDVQFLPGDLSSIRSDVEIDELSGSIFGFGVRTEQHATLSILGTSITISPMNFKSEESEFALSGKVDFSSNLDLQLKGMTRLDALSEQSSSIRNASGIARFDLNIKGQAADPDYDGVILIQELYFTNPLLGIKFEDFHAEIICQHKLGHIQFCQGIAGNSYTYLTGEFGIRNHLPDLLDLKLKSSQLEFEFPEGLLCEADIDLNLVGHINSPLLMGNINLNQASYSRRINYKSMIVNESRAKLSLRRKPSQVISTERPPVDLGLKLQIFAPDRVEINNNLAKIEMKLDLSLNGSVAKPRLFGRIEAIAGKVDFQGREFDLERATIDFLSAETIDPTIDLLATSDIESYRVSIEMSGSLLNDFYVRPFSSPALSEVDLWSLLAIGKTTEQLSNNSQDYLASGVAYVTGSLQDQIERRVKYWMGFDEFSIDPILSTSDESPSARITVKKQLNPNLSVTYSRRAASTGDLLIIEYKIADNIFLIGRRNEDGSLGGDLRFRWEFR